MDIDINKLSYDESTRTFRAIDPDTAYRLSRSVDILVANKSTGRSYWFTQYPDAKDVLEAPNTGMVGTTVLRELRLRCPHNLRIQL